jgi:hypothetical protein
MLCVWHYICSEIIAINSFSGGNLMGKFICYATLLLVIVGLTANQSSATVITSLPGGTVIAIPGTDYFGSGPQTFGPGITWSSTNASNQSGSVFGYTGGYGFSGNGYWDGNLGPMAGLNDSFDIYGVTDTMTFAFSSPISAVGGFLNYVPGTTSPTISVYDAQMNLIESTTLAFLTDGSVNSGFFYGFQEDSDRISYFTLTNNYIGLANLTVSGNNPVPEPSTLLLLSAGILGVGLLRKKF